MKHLKKYDTYITEELREEEKRMILHSPILIGGFLLKKIFKLFPLLNYRYKEIKKKTNDSNFRSIIATSSSNGSQVKEPWRKITKEDFPKTKLSFGLMLDKWNFYIKEGGNDPGRVDRVKRDFIYITKDEINVGDYITGDRLSDNDVYDLKGKSDEFPSFFDTSKNPAIVVCAKFDNIEKSEDVKFYIEDVLLSEWEEYPYPERKITSNKQSDKYHVSVRLDEVYDEKLGEKANKVAKRISGYLNDEGFGNFKTSVNFIFDISNRYYLVKYYKGSHFSGGVTNKEIKATLIDILGKEVLDKTDWNSFECVDGKLGSNWVELIPIDTSLKGLLPGRIFKTEFMNKLNNNKDLILPSEYSMKSVSEIKVNMIQFIVEKIH